MSRFFTALSFLLVIAIILVAQENTKVIQLTNPLPPTLSKNKKPYFISEHLEVPQGELLIIEKGTIILFSNFAGLTIRGGLMVDGTESDPVVFTSENDTIYNKDATLEPAAFDWDGIILFKGQSPHIINHAFIQYSVFGIQSNTNEFVLEKCQFKENGKHDLTMFDNNIEVLIPTHSYAPVNYRPPLSMTIKPETYVQEENTKSNNNKRLITEVKPPPKLSNKKSTNLAPLPRKKEIRNGVAKLLSLGSIACGTLYGTIELIKYLDAKNEFDRLNEINSKNLTSPYIEDDWRHAKNNANNHQVKMAIGYGTVCIGTVAFVLTIVF